jgi:chromosome segregation ATPase
LKNRLKEYDEKNEIKNAIYNTRKIEMYIEEKIAESEEANIQSIKKIENLNEKIETTKVSLQKKEEERAQLEEECKKLKEEINVIKTDPIQIVQVKKKIEEKMVECKDEINLLKKELEDSKTKNNNLNLQFNNYKVSMEHEIEYQKSEKTKLQEHIEELKREAVESRKVLDKVYESYENSKITLEQLLLNNELLKSELINKQKLLFSKEKEFQEFNKTNQFMERNYFRLIKLEKYECNVFSNDLLSVQVQLKQEANRIDQVVETYKNASNSSDKIINYSLDKKTNNSTCKRIGSSVNKSIKEEK